MRAAAEALGRELFTAQVTNLSLPAEQFVTNLYEGFLQRGPDTQGLLNWTAAAGTTTQNRQSVLNAFAVCPPFRELAGTLHRETFWLVTDQLGTPRMIVDRTGSLAGVKRHDYLPFGEEIQAGVGGRTQSQGYSQLDGVRQGFTGYEKDGETELNYAKARYFSSMQGRFTSPDPLLSSGSIYNSQTWNRYSHTLNNPLKFTDPNGLYVFDPSATRDQRRQFEEGLRRLQTARDSFRSGSDEYNRLDRAIGAYGAAGVDNGVTIRFGATRNGGAADTNVGIRDRNGDAIKDVTADNPTGQDTIVTIDPAQNGSTNAYTISISHEGSHVADGADLVGAVPTDYGSTPHAAQAADAVLNGSLNLTRYVTESRAYVVSATVAQGLNNARYDVGSLSITSGRQNIEIWRAGWRQADQAAIDRVLATPRNQGGLYEVGPAPAHQGPRLIQ